MKLTNLVLSLAALTCTSLAQAHVTITTLSVGQVSNFIVREATVIPGGEFVQVLLNTDEVAHDASKNGTRFCMGAGVFERAGTTAFEFFKMVQSARAAGSEYLRIMLSVLPAKSPQTLAQDCAFEVEKIGSVSSREYKPIN